MELDMYFNNLLVHKNQLKFLCLKYQKIYFLFKLFFEFKE